MHRTDSERFLRRAITANGIFSLLSGVVLTAGAGMLSPLLGIPWMILALVGVSLLLFAATLIRAVRGAGVDLKEARRAIAMDVAWVLGSLVVLLIQPAALTTVGWWAIAGIADLVAVLAALQFYGLRQAVAGISAETPS